MKPEPSIIITKRCISCRITYEIPVTAAEFKDLTDPACHKHIQDILPDLTPGERELFISGICDSCFPRSRFADEEWG